MIHVKVEPRDIRKGRMNAGSRCGCPIWHALRRSLRPLTKMDSEEELKIPNVGFATFKGWRIILPGEAQYFQDALMEDFSAPVEPFEFDADVEIPSRGGKKR